MFMNSSGTVYRPFPWQVEAWRDKSRVVLLTGAAGGGKSRIAAEKIHAFNLKYPGATTIVGRKDKTSASKSVVPFLQHTVMGGTNWGNFHKSDGLFEYKNGSQMWVVGLRDESQREALRSIGKDGAVDLAWFEEANKLTEDDDNEIVGRMRGTKGAFRQRMYSTNPGPPDHWIKKKLIDMGGASVYYSRPEENPFNPPDYIEGLKGLTGVYRQRLWKGLWVQAEGVVFSEYNSLVHLMDEDILCPPSYRYIVTVDFGFTAPFSCILWMITPGGKMIQVKEIYQSERLVEDHAPEIRKMLASVDLPLQRVEAWVCDHDAEDRATLEKHLGIRTIAAMKSVSSGIEAVDGRFKRNMLYLNRRALWEVDTALEAKYKPTSLVEEVTGYIYSDKKQDTPVKENDHGCDGMRYGVAYVDKVGRSSGGVSASTDIQNYITGAKKKDGAYG